MDFFEKDGVVYKNIPAGGHGGGVTGAVTVKASLDEAEAYRASLPVAEPAPEPEAPAAPSISVPQQDAKAIEDAVAKAVADSHAV